MGERKLSIALCAPVSLRDLSQHLDEYHFATDGLGSSLVADLARELHQRGHQIHVVTLSPEPIDHGRHFGERLTVDVGPFRPRARSRLGDSFRVERKFVQETVQRLTVDVVHAHWTYEFALGALRAEPKTLVTVHDWAPAVLKHHRDVYRLVRLGMQRATLRRARHLTAVSPYIRDHIHPSNMQSLDLVPNGLPEHSSSTSRDAPSTGAFVIGAVNVGFSRRKNVVKLLQGFHLLRRDLEDARLVLAGPGYGVNGEAQKWADQNGLASGVEFLGPLDNRDIPAFMASLSVFAHPSLEESFGLVLIEAMQAGTAVVGGQRSGAVPWILRDGQAGVLVDVTDPVAICTALRDLARDEEMKTLIGEAGRAYAAEMFSLASSAQLYESIYLRIAQPGSSA